MCIRFNVASGGRQHADLRGSALNIFALTFLSLLERCLSVFRLSWMVFHDTNCLVCVLSRYNVDRVHEFE